MSNQQQMRELKETKKRGLSKRGNINAYCLVTPNNYRQNPQIAKQLRQSYNLMNLIC
jgi:hypothetical protein